MVEAIKQRVTVQPGGVVEVRSLELESRPGEQADVIILLDAPPVPAHPPRTLVSFIGSAKGLFTSVEDVDAYVRELRDEWDR